MFLGVLVVNGGFSASSASPRAHFVWWHHAAHADCALQLSHEKDGDENLIALSPDSPAHRGGGADPEFDPGATEGGGVAQQN